MPGLTPVRVRLSVEQKVKIIEESKKKGFCRKDICEKYGISAATLSQILKNQKVHLSTFDSGLPGKHKTIRKSALPNVEEALYEWFLKLTRQNVPVSGPMLIGRAQKLHEKLNKNDKEFSFSHGWLDRFKKRYNIKFKTIVGEIKSADTEAAEDWLEKRWPELREWH